MMYDILIVGAGLYGAICANELSRSGFRCVVIEKRSHIGGNCFTECRDGINIHRYGPHIFHTRNAEIWKWINQFAKFNHFRYHGRVCHSGRIYSFPPNLMTFHQMWGVTTPEEARERLARSIIPMNGPENLESWALANMGREAYELFIRGYSAKQWGRPPAELPASIIKRLPIRFTYDDNYFEDPYQGIPVGGYTGIFSKLLDGIETRLNVDYFAGRDKFDSMAKMVLYTVPIDQFFGCRFGKLAYRGLRFEHEMRDVKDFQGAALVNYTSEEVPFTRIIEHKHFEFGAQPMTWISREYPVQPSAAAEPFYPVKDRASEQLLTKYVELGKASTFTRFRFGGRLAQYQYFDMHQVIAAALKMTGTLSQELAERRRSNPGP
jgi:UDP-galactopyranose mutase